MKAFLPGSQVDLRPVRNLDAFIGQNFKFKVIKFNKKRGNIVLSRRVLLEKERAALKETTLERLKEGQIVEGIVKNLTEYGAFIDLGGIDGLLHITDMSWGRVNHPSELFQVGDHVRVKVLKFNADTERVSLGLKQISEDPWSRAAEKYVPGTVVRGKVVSLKDYGAFIELEEGIEGLVHISEMSWTRRVKHPSKMVAVGDMVEAVVLDVDVKQNRISLGMKQLEPNPYEQLTEKYPPGTVVKGHVRNIADFGIFVEIEEGIDGLVHISDMSLDPAGQAPVASCSRRATRSRPCCSTSTRRRRQAEDLARHQAAGPGSVGSHPVRLPGRQDRRRQGPQGPRLRRLRRAREGRRGSGPRLRDQPRSASRIRARCCSRARTSRSRSSTLDAAERKIGLSIKGAIRAKEMADAQGYTVGRTPAAPRSATSCAASSATWPAAEARGQEGRQAPARRRGARLRLPPDAGHDRSESQGRYQDGRRRARRWRQDDATSGGSALRSRRRRPVV